MTKRNNEKKSQVTVVITNERFRKLNKITEEGNKKRATTASILLSKAIDDYEFLKDVKDEQEDF